MNKLHITTSQLFLSAIFCSLILPLSGCVGGHSPQMRDSMSYVRLHKGEGTRMSLVGSEAELMDRALEAYREPYITTREPHALFATATTVNLSYAVYFYPSQTLGQTDVEVIEASPWVRAEEIEKDQKTALVSTFYLNYIMTRISEADYDVNKSEGGWASPLTAAAYYGNRGLAIKLINKGADVDTATYALKKWATPCASPDKKICEHYDTGIALLSSLKRTSQQSETADADDANFQKALRANISIATQKQQMDSARKFKVQAEDAVHESNFDEAIDLYQQALEIAPLWPEGHYNRALLLGNRGDYEIAIREMKRYLLLVPNASNAGAAQNKIYSWERKAGTQN